MSREGALWMGDINETMDENFIIQAFADFGEHADSVRLIRNKYTGQLAGYGFVHFKDDQTALSALHSVNSKMIPHSQPQTRFKLNHSSVSRSTVDKEFSLWVGDLSTDVDQAALYKAFASRYTSVKKATVIVNAYGISKGYGFIRIANEDEYKDCLMQMNGFSGLGSNPLRVSLALPRKIPSQDAGDSTQSQVSSGGSYGQYYEHYWQNYAAWQNYGSYYDNSYGYSMPTFDWAGGGETQAENNDTYDEYEVIEHNVPVDVDKLNKELIERNEEMWNTLEESRWLPPDSLNPLPGAVK